MSRWRDAEADRPSIHHDLAEASGSASRPRGAIRARLALQNRMNAETEARTHPRSACCKMPWRAEFALPLPDSLAYYIVRASGAAIARGDVVRLPAAASFPSAVQVLHAEVTTSALVARLRLEIPGEYLVEAIQVLESWQPDMNVSQQRNACVSNRLLRPTLLARLHVHTPPGLKQVVTLVPQWIARQHNVPLFTRAQVCKGWSGSREALITALQLWFNGDQRAVLHQIGAPLLEVTNTARLSEYAWTTFDYRTGTAMPPTERPMPTFPGLCIVGRSHSRMMRNHINGSRYVYGRWASDLTMVGSSFWRSLRGCSATLFHFGQWDLSSQSGLHAIEDSERDHHKLLNKSLSSAPGMVGRVAIAACNPSPLSCMVTTCPPLDWRTPPNFELYNAMLQRVAKSWDVPFIDTSKVVGPVWDTSPDWNHLDSSVQRIVAEQVVEGLR